MALPKIDTPVYELTLPLSNKKIKYRPFLVKEQRNLLMALESDDTETIEQNIKQVLTNCTLTEGIDIYSLPLLDVEYYFIQLRARSVGEIVENRYRCNNEVNEKECGNIMEVDVNILEIQIQRTEEMDNNIQISDNLFVKMKYPEFSIIKRIASLQSVTELAFDVVAESIESIYDGKQYYYSSEAEPSELIEFVESLSQEQFSKLEAFFNNLPKLSKTVDVTCSKCGYNHHIDVEGLESFFV